MNRQITLLLVAALLGLAQAQQPQITAAPAPQLTAHPGTLPKGQVIATIEIHQDYAAPIGGDTGYLALDGTSTKWIGVNTQYLTESTRTTTIGGVETPTVVRPQLAVVTAAEATEGVEVGDVTVLMSDVVQDKLDVIIKEAAAACGAGAKLRSRDVMSCMIDAMQRAAQNDESLGLINPAEWDGFSLKLSKDAPDILRAAFQVLKTQAQRNKFAIMVAAAATAGALVGEQFAEASHKLVFSGGEFGYHDKNGNDACDDSDCLGKHQICTAEGKNKNCPCVLWTKKMVEGLFDRAWSDEQQKILLELEIELPAVIPPQCFRNTFSDGFDGKPRGNPSAYCVCSSAIDGGGMTKGTFPTMSGEGDKACTYTTMPAETISISLMPTQDKVTSCRFESKYSPDRYCTCNDDKMHGEIVTTYLGSVVTVCPDAAPTMTGIQNGRPTEEATCYPTHGPEHSDPKLDELIKLCAAGGPQFDAVCRTDASKPIRVDCPAPGAIPKGENPTHFPIVNNHYDAWFEKAEDAPEDCKFLFRQSGSENGAEVGARVDALCIPAFEAIRDKCTWNGGEVKNQCGTFKYMSCPLGGMCKPGTPYLTPDRR